MSKIFSLFFIFFLFFNSCASESKRAIVIGASSGMGRAVAKLLAKEGYTLGLASRRVNLLQSLQEEIGSESYIRKIDVSRHEEAAVKLKELIDQMGGLDLILICSSSYFGFDNSWESNKKMIDVDVGGFWAMAHEAIKYFEKQGYGHLVGISSIDGLRGSANCPVYSGAKAFISRYLEGIRNMMLKKNIPIYVTDIVPGWVDVEHTVFSQIPGTYWVSTKEDAAKQIVQAIKAKKKVAYITKRWQIIAILLALLPDYFYNKINF